MSFLKFTFHVKTYQEKLSSALNDYFIHTDWNRNPRWSFQY